MKRIVMLLTMVALMMAIMAMSVAPAFANHATGANNKTHGCYSPGPGSPPHCVLLP